MALATTALPPALACKYTVRDVAFVELGDRGYQLYLYLDEAIPGEYAALLQSAAEQAFVDSNVGLRIVAKVQSGSEEQRNHLELLGAAPRPAALLVAPDRRVKRIPWPAQQAEGHAEDVKQAMTSIVRSPQRDVIMSQLAIAHSVVLIVESDDPAQNQLARVMVDSAVARIESSLPDLPKPIEGSPQVITIAAEDVLGESILLWSLGVDLESVNRTQIAMLFGRGRSLGKVMAVPEIAEQDLLRNLAIVGLDCECELDRSLMQTPMIPHVWTEADESRAAKSLGFDPGHPLVKVEISRILSRGPSSTRSNGTLGSGQDTGRNAAADLLLPGLQIIELDFDDDETDLDTEQTVRVDGGGSKTSSPALSGSDSEPTNRESARHNLSSEMGVSDRDPVDEGEREPAAMNTVADAAEGSSTTSTTQVVSATLVGLAIAGLLGGALVVFWGRRSA